MPKGTKTGRKALWTLNIPDFFPKGPNQLAGAHWQVVRKHRKLVSVAVMMANANQPVPRFVNRPTVLVMRLYGKKKRALDPDNAMAAIKPLIDALRENTRKTSLGVFADDRESDINLLPVVQRKSTDGRTWTRVMVSGELAPDIQIEYGPGSQIEMDAQIDLELLQ